MNLKSIISIVQNPQTSPSELSKLRTNLAGELALINQEYAQIKIRKPLEWTKLRTQSSSVKETDMKFTETPDGKREIEIHYEREYLKSLISSVKQRIDVARDESMNSY